MATVDSTAGTELGTIETKIPGAARSPPVVSLALEDRGRARDGLDPRRARGHDRRFDRRRDLGDKGSGIDISAAEVGRLGGVDLRRRRLRRRAPVRPADRPVRPQETVHDHARRLPGRDDRHSVLVDTVFFFVCRFVTGMGIGGEYSAINSAIDELIPAQTAAGSTSHKRTYWVGSRRGRAARRWPR